MKKALRGAAFLCVFFLLFACFSTLFRFKYSDGIEPLTRFYKQEENTLDALFFGSSHMFVGVNPLALWEGYGIPAFVVGGSEQPFWNSYYYIKECLKTQTPKVVVLDVFDAAWGQEEYSDYSRIVKNNFGLKLSRDKIESIRVSAPKELWVDLLLGFPAYHARYGELNQADLDALRGKEAPYLNGYYFSNRTEAFARPDISGVTATSPLHPKHEAYLLKIIELVRASGSQLLLIKTPYAITAEDQTYYNRVAQIAEAEGVPFLNYNLLYDELGLDFATDMTDPAHLTYAGSQKFTAHLGAYLAGHYALQDKRADEAYAHWHAWQAEAEAMVRQKQALAQGEGDGTFEAV